MPVALDSAEEVSRQQSWAGRLKSLEFGRFCASFWPMRWAFTLVVAICLTFGLTGFSGSEPLIQHGLQSCGHCSSPKAAGGDRASDCSCCANCPLCSGPSALIPPVSDAVRVRLMDQGRALDLAWLAARRTYPPPLPPPRL